MRISKEKSGKEVLGKEVLGKEVLGKEVLGKEVLGKEVLGKEVLGKEVLGKEVLGKEVLSKEVLGKEVLGKEVLGREDRVQKQRSLSAVDSFIGKDIYIILRGGDKLEGKLESVTQYETIVTISYQPVIVMKHAIDYMGLVGEK